MLLKIIKKLDEACIKEVVKIGYRKEHIIKSLIDNLLNYASAAYYILETNYCN